MFDRYILGVQIYLLTKIGVWKPREIERLVLLRLFSFFGGHHQLSSTHENISCNPTTKKCGVCEMFLSFFSAGYFSGSSC